MRRIVRPELLDHLVPADPLAVGSRNDLRRLNVLMGHSIILFHWIEQCLIQNRRITNPLRLVELGAGDGTLLLRLAHRMADIGLFAHAILVDRNCTVSERTRRDFLNLNWTVETSASEATEWLRQTMPPADLILANLVLHHFSDPELSSMFEQLASKTACFIACEPRRSILSRIASHLIGLTGCNAVTRHDAVLSVKAGFSGHELSTLWTSRTSWLLREFRAGAFSHCFIARKRV